MADKSYKLTLSLSDGSTINAGTITAPQGPNGANGVTFTPSVSAAGVLSWTNNGGLTNPSPISIKGPKGDDAVITESDVKGWGFTKNIGTITEIKMNGASKGKSGVVDLGTVFTAHTGLVGGNLVQYDSTAQTLKDSGKKISDLATTSQVNAKYTKPSGGIPKTDLASDVKTSLGKADNAVPNTRKVNNKSLSSDITLGAADVGVTETAFPGLKKTGTVTGVKMNGTTKNPSSGVVDIGTVITDVSGKQDKITSSNKLAASLVSGLSSVATSGSYNDLSNKPTIPAAANNGTLTIKKNGTNVATFSANQSGNATANITVPTFSLSGTTLTITV